jgi:cardiolipin hydrolase
MNFCARTLFFFCVFFCSNHGYATSIQVYFAPDDRPAGYLIKEIEQTTDKIYAAIYYLSDQNITNALIRAHERKVDVRIISDPQTSKTVYSKLKQLYFYGLKVFIPEDYSKTKGFVRTRLMHHKFAILNGKVWVGSYNWTVGANIFNFEDALVITDPAIYKIFLNRYLELEKQCIKFVPAAALPTKSMQLISLSPLVSAAFRTQHPLSAEFF